MLQRAQDLFEQLRVRVKSTLQVVADLAETVGVPSTLTSLLQPKEQTEWSPPRAAAPPPTGVGTEARSDASRAADSRPAGQGAPAAESEPDKAEASPSASDGGADAGAESRSGGGTNGRRAARRKAARKRVLEGDRELSSDVRPLKVDDAINGSTYLARIIWSLGVAELEQLGPLRPADIARMVMGRSPVSLEPPNVARYIRRSKPSCIVVARTEGSSSYYELNAEGREMFEQQFGGRLN